MKTTFTLFLAILLVSCNKKSETLAPEAAPAEVSDVINPECYIFTTGKDTIRLKLAMNSHNANGELQFKFSEKDNSNGTLSGAFVGDTLFADYIFRSEGTTSVREMVFLRKAASMVVGTGEMEEHGGKQVFKNSRNVAFDNGVVLTKSDCK